MDGFFVCKIQKLSDNIPGKKKEGEGQGQEEVVFKDGAKSTDERDEDTKKGGKKESKLGKQFKRGRSTADDTTPTKKSKTDKLSVPPPKQNQKKKKKKLNAKMTKPRRQKIDKEMI